MPTSPSPTSPARSVSPARRCTGTSPAPTPCWWRPPCTPPTTSWTGWKRTFAASPTPSTPSTEAIATALEWLPKDKHLGLLIVPGRPNPHIESVTRRRRTRLRPLDGAPVRRRLGRPWLQRRRSRRTRRASAADHPVVRHRPGPSAAHGRGAARLPAAVGGCRYTTVSGSDLRGSNTNVGAAAEPHNRNFTQFLCRRVGFDHPGRPVRVGSRHLDVEMRVRRRRRPPAAVASTTAPTSDTHAPSSCAGERLHMHRVRPELGRHVGRRVEHRMQFERADRALDAARQPERTMDAFGGDAGDADQLFGADLGRELGVGARPACPTARTNDRFSRCICRQTSSAMRTSAECENAAKSKSDSSAPE